MDLSVLALGALLGITGVGVLGRGQTRRRRRRLPAFAAPGARPRTETVVLVENPAALIQHVQAWDELAAEALEANPFYESWMLRPALEAFGKRRRLEFVLVYRPREPSGTGQRLVGFFPLERRRHYKGLPASVLRLWKHEHCFLCTPLLHAGHAREALAAFFDWAAHHRRGAALIEFGQVPTDGPFHQHLAEYLDRRQRPRVLETFKRAFFRTQSSADAFLSSALSPGYRKEMRRLRKRLGETGPLEFRTLRTQEELDAGIEDFIELEAQGWKGPAGAGTAIALHENEANYCREVWRAALQRGRLHMAGLYRYGNPIAITVNCLAGDGGFHCKITYDENYTQYSPGVQLELELIRAAHAQNLRWLDSCAAPGHPMINRLWPERRTMQTTLFSTGRWHGDLSVSVLPMLRRLKRARIRRAPS